MRHYLLSEPQRSMWRKTDLFVLEPGVDFTQATDNTDQIIVLDALAFGDVVGYEAMIQIRKALGTTGVGTGVPSADFALTISLGVTGAVTQIIGASALAAAGVATAAKTAYCTAAGGAAYPTPAGGKDLVVNLDITDVDGSLAEIEYGEIWIWVSIDREGQMAQFEA